jgi:hypothetical protein
LIQKTATEAPSTYPLGVSLYRSGSGFPMDALVRTTRGQYTGDAMQENIPMGGGFGNINQGYYVRFGTFSNGTWGAWQYVGPTPKATNPESLYTSVTTGSTTPIPGSGDGTIIKNANGFFGWDATTGIWVKLNN